ncbi:MAG: hypothetical protein KF744_16075 [Taibaiella sp.]|nr:hypothetical protein [Taibaiella sp.]
MNKLRRILLFFVALPGLGFGAIAQEKPIGSWKSFLPYNNAVGVATSGTKLFVAGSQGFYTFDIVAGQIDAYSKVEGMSDIGLQCVGYDMSTSMAILGYTNGNIDLFKDNTFYNIPDLKIKSIAGAKTIFSIYTHNGLAYLGTSIGVIVLDLTKRTIKETYEFTLDNKSIPVRGTTIKDDSLYALTSSGIYRANLFSSSLQNYQSWLRIDSAVGYTSIAAEGNSIFMANDTIVYRLGSGVRSLVYRSPSKIEHIDIADSKLHICEYDTATYSGKIEIYTLDGTFSDAVDLTGKHPAQVVRTGDGAIWIAEEFGGLMKCNEAKELGYYTPTGPSNFNSFDIEATNGELWIAHGGYDDKFSGVGRYNAFSHYNDGKWDYLERFLYRPFDTLVDFCNIELDRKSGTKYMGSFESGLFVMNSDGTYKLYNVNSILEGNPNIGPSQRQVLGMKLDENGNLWMTELANSGNQLYVRTPEDQWYKYRVAGIDYGGPLLIDDNHRIWFVGVSGGGVGVYDFGSYETLGDKSDDAQYVLRPGVGYGNLPSKTVNCLAKDRNNNIWIGTAEGIGIVNNCTFPSTQSNPCDADIPIVQYDQFAGYLFAGNNVRTIAVDGANRKWVGTDDGVWLLSPDASKIVSRFTVENSPLPSNRIVIISIDQQTGEVYIGTEGGLVSYRGTSTEGGTSNKDVLCFPNPVPSGYGGTIAIRGLVDNADVRITDISGQLVYRTKAFGGQAVWNGVDYTGRRPQSGVYMIFASDANGAETYTGKLVFLK